MSANTLNRRPELDFNRYIDVTDNLSINLADLDNLNPSIFNLNECNYYDKRSILDKFANNKNLLFLSLNLQSLQSKFFELSTFANILQNRQILVDIIGLQEVWSIGSNIDSLDIPGFQRLIFKSRSLNKGGGVGFYVRSKIIEEPSVFQDGIFESICIELGYSTGKVIRFVSIYWLLGSISYLNNPQIIQNFLIIILTC